MGLSTLTDQHLGSPFVLAYVIVDLNDAFPLESADRTSHCNYSCSRDYIHCPKQIWRGQL